MFLRVFTFLTLSAALAMGAVADSGAHLGVAAQPAVAQIRPLSEGRKLVRLPALEYQLDIDTDCGGNAVAESVSISVNDTRMTLDGDHAANTAGEPVNFTVPARQVSPVAIDGFCMMENPGSQQGDLLIRDTVTVHLSLRCKGGEQEWITYASRGLDVTLRCDAPEENQSESEIDR